MPTRTSATDLLDIPFNRPSLVGKELGYIADAIIRGQASGDGAYTRKCQVLLERALNGPRVFLTTSCTDALEMTALLLDFQPGDEVIVPSFTFVSTVNAFVLRGARPVFVDVRPDTLNLDEEKLESLITLRTKAIVPVHYAGVSCELDSIMKIANRHSIALVEDNAHGVFDKYTWVDVGSSFLPSDILAAFLFAQLEAREEIQSKRKRVWDYYYQNLWDVAHKYGVVLPTVPPHCEQSYHMFYILVKDISQRQPLIEHLKSRGVFAIFHYMPLHLSLMG